MNWALVLVSPKGARNVGGVARAMGNFGFRDLRIVSPRCDLQSLDCKRMSMASFDIIENARVFSTLEEALSDRTLAIALSGRKSPDDRPRKNLFDFVEDAPSRMQWNDRVALIFGREEWGLLLEELDQCDSIVEIPTVSEKSSINLASAVAISLSILFSKSSSFLENRSQREFLLPEKKDEEFFFQRIRNLLDAIKFLNPQNPSQNLEDLRALYHRSEPSERDLRILFGVLAGVEKSMGLEGRKKSSQQIQPTN